VVAIAHEVRLADLNQLHGRQPTPRSCARATLTQRSSACSLSG
jgi:hypothetical protein